MDLQVVLVVSKRLSGPQMKPLKHTQSKKGKGFQQEKGRDTKNRRFQNRERWGFQEKGKHYGKIRKPKTKSGFEAV